MKKKRFANIVVTIYSKTMESKKQQISEIELSSITLTDIHTGTEEVVPIINLKNFQKCHIKLPTPTSKNFQKDKLNMIQNTLKFWSHTTTDS